MQQGMLFDVPRPERMELGNVYVMHMPQRSGPDMWKIGHTVRSVQVRAREIACVPIAWWPGTEHDERDLHRRFKRLRMSPSAEFFLRAPDIDQWVLQMARRAGRPAELAALAQIFLTWPSKAA